MNTFHKFICFLVFAALVSSCNNEEYVPKPTGYFRIALPEKKYQVFDSACPFSFEYPVYARIEPDTLPQAEKYWLNVDFPQFAGKIHLSYKSVDTNLAKLIEDARSMVNKHIQKASGIEQRRYENPTNHVYGLIYDISGSQTASTYQFYLTDSTQNFVRGALYFSYIPNNDSLSPVINFVKRDIEKLIESFRWKSLKPQGR